VTVHSTASIGGAARHFTSVLCPIVDPARGVTGVSGVSQDVTEHRQAEEALVVSEARFRALATASPLGVFLYDPAGAIQYANPRMREIWRLPVEAAFDMAAAMAAVHPSDASRVRARWEASLAAGVGAEQEFRLRFADGEERHLRTQMAPLREGDRVTGFVGTVDDDTERHALAQRVRQAERMEALGTLAGGIAHDFNNMLGVVLGHTEVALAEAAALGRAADALREPLGEVRTASLRARDLVRQILAFGRRTETERAPVDLRALTVESMRLLRPMLPSSVRLELRLPDHPLTVLGDASALQQVLVNLVTNAEHAMRATGGGVLAVALGAEGGAARLTVCDTGAGIAPEARERLFDPFFTTKPPGEGTGMGLAVAHGVATGARRGDRRRRRAGRGRDLHGDAAAGARRVARARRAGADAARAGARAARGGRAGAGALRDAGAHARRLRGHLRARRRERAAAVRRRGAGGRRGGERRDDARDDGRPPGARAAPPPPRAPRHPHHGLQPPRHPRGGGRAGGGRAAAEAVRRARPGGGGARRDRRGGGAGQRGVIAKSISTPETKRAATSIPSRR
jgi:PAS domain S-box-containing protein